jgi:hypothetical protein
MNHQTILTSICAVILALFLGACQQKETAGSGAPSSTPSPRLPTDSDLGHGYVRRDGAIHFIGGGITGNGANATRIDTPSPKLLKKVVNSKYGPFKTAEGLDVASFEAMSEVYTRDKDRVYFKVISSGEFLVIVLPEADPASFEVLATDLARDKNHVWHCEYLQAGVDPATVKLVNGGTVYKDKDSVHYQSETIAGADAASFKHLNSGYYADRGRVYWCTSPIPDADLATFEVLGGSFFAKDKTSVYRSGERLPGLDLGSLKLILFEPAGYHILSDKNGLHLDARIFPRSKPGEFEVIDKKTIKAGPFMYLVSTYNDMAVTVFREEGKLMAEAHAYDPGNKTLLGTISAEVTEQGLRNIRTKPAPGGTGAPSVPGWQIDRLKMPDLVHRMIEAGKRI